MSEEEPKITSVVKKEKHPGRVAAGKRLAAISKEAKERKKLEREEAMKKSEDNDSNNALIVGGLIVAVAGAVAYFLWKKKGESNVNENVTIEEPKESNPRPKRSRYSMADNR